MSVYRMGVVTVWMLIIVIAVHGGFGVDEVRADGFGSRDECERAVGIVHRSKGLSDQVLGTVCVQHVAMR